MDDEYVPDTVVGQVILNVLCRHLGLLRAVRATQEIEKQLRRETNGRATAGEPETGTRHPAQDGW